MLDKSKEWFRRLIIKCEPNEETKERIAFLEKENDAIWSRMVELEAERNAHDGTLGCPGCADEVQRHIDDLDIDSLIPGGLNALIKSILAEELYEREVNCE